MDYRISPASDYEPAATGFVVEAFTFASVWSDDFPQWCIPPEFPTAEFAFCTHHDAAAWLDARQGRAGGN